MINKLVEENILPENIDIVLKFYNSKNIKHIKCYIKLFDKEINYEK
jgi:hypothetical protein